VTPELWKAIENTRINPTGELTEPMPIPAAAQALDKLHGFTPTETDRQESERHMTQLKGQFLVDRDGIVRWANIETASEGLAGLGKFPTEQQLVEIVRALPK
jgi:hypothetical protein